MRNPSRRFTVHGRVQGVFFRDSTRREAERLGISGHAVNLPDGSVEVMAAGPAEALAALERWLHRGPPMSRVTRVEVAAAEGEVPMGFRTG
jgi:acylphosphatase